MPTKQATIQDDQEKDIINTNDEDDLPESNSKWNSIMMKHKNVLGINTLANSLKDSHKRSKSDVNAVKTQELLKKKEQEVDDTQERYNPNQWRKMNVMVKDV